MLQVKVPCKYDRAYPFSEGLAEVWSDWKWGFVDVTGKGFLGSDAKTSVQVDLGNIAVKAGANTIVISALKQAPNMDCIALIADGITFSLPQA